MSWSKAKAVMLGMMALAGCDSVTSVEAPDVIQASDYTNTAGATALAAGALSRFQIAFGREAGMVFSSGLMSDELLATTSVNPTYAVFDSRDASDPANSGFYTLPHTARLQLLTAIEMFQRVAPDSAPRIGQMYALLGYTSVFLGEAFCAGVPLSRRDADLRPVHGLSLTTEQIFDSAITAFDSALIYGVDSARFTNLARVGMARALLNQGRFAEAAAAVATVPTSYVYDVTFLGTNGLNNGFVSPTGNPTFTTAVTIPDREGVNGINWRTAAGTTSDPRTPLINRNQTVGGVALWGYAAYNAATAPIRLAGGIEARLIEAEAALQVGNSAGWLATLNALRALGTAGGGANGLPPLADPGTPAARVDLHFRERAMWLFLTGHRLGDLRRLVRQYGREAETVYPIGASRDGLPYGNATSMAPPVEQLRNPNYAGCINRDA